MKIALLTSQYPPIVGGVAKITSMVANELVRRRHEVHVYTDVGKTFSTVRFPGTKLIEKNGNLLLKRHVSKNLFRGYHLNSKMLKDLLKEDYDVIHSYHFGYFPATVGLLASKLRKIPHIFTLEYHPPIYGLSRKLLFWSYHLTQGLPLLRFSDRVIALTNYEKSLLMKIGAKTENMIIIPNPIDAKFFHKVKSKLKKRYGLKKRVVLYVGGSSKSKGMDVIFKMAEKITKRHDCSFVLLGHGPLQESLERKNENRDIIFLPWVNKNDLREFYSISDMLVHPSYYESFGMVLAEAMACELPIVSTKQGGIPEVVGDAGLLVNYGNWEKFEDYVEILLHDSILRKKMGKAGRKRVVEKFDLKPVVDNLIKVYEDVQK